MTVKRGFVAKFLQPDAIPVANQQESANQLALLFYPQSLLTSGRGITPFTSALRCQYLDCDLVVWTVIQILDLKRDPHH